MKNSELTWVEIDREAIAFNVANFRKLIGSERILCPAVKANAYGHGLVETSRLFLEAGANWLGVNSLYEAERLRESGVDVPIYIMGYVALQDFERVAELGECRMVLYNREAVRRMAEIDRDFMVHVKVETGNNRQGVLLDELVDFAEYVRSFPHIKLEGLATHFANIEDTTDHSYAEKQLRVFQEAIARLEAAAIQVPVKHCANSAAALLFPETHFDMVRTGIATYGMWPSKETHISYLQEVGSDFSLKPAFTWKTKVAQVKEIDSGEYVGYGCTYRTTRKTRLAILPIGYYDGYDRCMSGAYVLIKGMRAPVRGRICMNITMVDVTDIPDVELEDEVVLLGRQADEVISAEQFAAWAGTINYEVVTRVNDRIPRIVV